MDRNLKPNDPTNCPGCGADLIRRMGVLDCPECAFQIDDSHCKKEETQFKPA